MRVKPNYLYDAQELQYKAKIADLIKKLKALEDENSMLKNDIERYKGKLEVYKELLFSGGVDNA